MNALKHGLHALKAVEKGKHGGFNIGGYAVKAGRSIQTISREVQAAKVWADFRLGRNFDAFKLLSRNRWPSCTSPRNGYGRR
jgi:hypothetical protein